MPMMHDRYSSSGSPIRPLLELPSLNPFIHQRRSNGPSVGNTPKKEILMKKSIVQ